MPEPHWADVPLDDDPANSSVRPYTITQGRTASARPDLTLITVIAALEPEQDRIPARGLEPEHRFILDRCRTPTALAELAAGLNLPVAVTKILICDLIALGAVTTRHPREPAAGQNPDTRLLQAVRDGLRRL